MKRCVFALFALLSTSALGQTSAVGGWCEQGAKPATVSGLNSTNKLQGIIPGCTVTVYFTGTSTQVPGSSIFADSIGTVLGNPFTANTTTGQYLFYAANGIGLDVSRSSGTTQTDVIPGGGGGGGSGVTSINGNPGSFTFTGPGVSCVGTTCTYPTGGLATVSSPLVVTGSNISLPQASASASGYLGSGDWTTFNAKQNALINPMTGTGTAGQVPEFTGVGGATTPVNVNVGFISAPLVVAGTSGNGAAYAGNTTPTTTFAPGDYITFFPDAFSVAGATLAVNGFPAWAIVPPLTAAQWNNRSPGQLLEFSSGQCPLCSNYWQQVNVTSQSSNGCTNTGTTTAMVCTSVDPACSIIQGYVLSLIVPVSNGLNPTLQFTCGVSSITYPITNSAHVAIPSNYLIVNGLNSLTIDTSGTGYFVASGTTLPLPVTSGGTGCTTAPCAVSSLLSNPSVGVYSINCTSGTACTPIASTSGIGGSGTTGYLACFTAANAIGGGSSVCAADYGISTASMFTFHSNVSAPQFWVGSTFSAGGQQPSFNVRLSGNGGVGYNVQNTSTGNCASAVFAANGDSGGTHTYGAFMGFNGSGYNNTTCNIGIAGPNSGFWQVENGNAVVGSRGFNHFQIAEGLSTVFDISNTNVTFANLASLSGLNCLQVDSSGNFTNTGTPCGSSGGSGTINPGTSGVTPDYTATGTVVGPGPQKVVCMGIVANGCSDASHHWSGVGGSCVSGAPTDDSPVINACLQAKIPVILPTQQQGNGGLVTLISHPALIGHRGQELGGSGFGQLSTMVSGILNLTGVDAVDVNGLRVLAQGIGCSTTAPLLGLTLSGTAFSGTATVLNPGAGCPTSGVTWVFTGYNSNPLVPATPGTATVNPTWSGISGSATLASATITPGTSTGYAIPNETLQGVNIHDFNIIAPTSAHASGAIIQYSSDGTYGGDDNTISNIFGKYHADGILSSLYGNLTCEGIIELQTDNPISFVYGGGASNSSTCQKLHASAVQVSGIGNWWNVGDSLQGVSTTIGNANFYGGCNTINLGDTETSIGPRGWWADNTCGNLIYNYEDGVVADTTGPLMEQTGGTFDLGIVMSPAQRSSLATNYPIFNLAASGSSSSCISATRYYKMYANNPSGAGPESTEQSISPSAGQNVVLTWPQMPGVQYYTIEEGASPGSEAPLLTGVIQGNVVTYTDTCTLTTSGSHPTTTMHYGLGSQMSDATDMTYIGTAEIGGGATIGQDRADKRGEYFWAFDHMQIGNANFPPGGAYTNRGEFYRLFAPLSSVGVGDALDYCYENSSKVYTCTNLLNTLNPTTTGFAFWTGSAWSGTTYAAQGTDTNVLTSGTVSGTGANLCTDANGGATTSGCPTVSVQTSVPAWMWNLGNGQDGCLEINTTGTGCSVCSINCHGGTPAAPYAMLNGEYYLTTFNLDSGAAVKAGLTGSGTNISLHTTGACTIAGSILANGVYSTNFGVNKGYGGATGGGGGGGTAGGNAGPASYAIFAQPGGISAPLFAAGGTAGGATAGAGGAGNTPGTTYQRAWVNSGAGLDGTLMTGTIGGTGGSSGGAGGNPGGGFTLIAFSLNGSGGVIDVSGMPGQPPTANSEGCGGGGGGGVVIIASQSAVTNWPAIYAAPGGGCTAPSGSITVPLAIGSSGSCTTEPQATIAVSAGAFSGTCTVVTAGAGCGTGAGMGWNFYGGGGTPGTAVLNPTWSGGALASCTVTPGTSSGYTAATYTGVGNGAQGGAGWSAGAANNVLTYPAP